MRIIRSSYEIEVMPGYFEWVIPHIEKAIRTCYKSEDKIEEGSAEKIINKILESKHMSTIEHGGFSVRFIIDRGVSHELVRHRIASFSQESTRYCVVGDTRLSMKNPHQKYTIEELFNNKVDSKNGGWKRMKIKYMDMNGELSFGTVKDVWKEGEKNTLRITTKLGYNIECTHDHEIFTDSGYRNATEIVEGDRLAVNGQVPIYRDYEWLYNQYTVLNKTAVDISNEFDFNVSTIKKWVKLLKLPTKPKSYWNKNKTPWNKGLKEGDDPRVGNQANSLREYHNDGQNTQLTRKERVKKLSKRTYHKMVGNSCEICTSKKTLQVHHIDENRDNNGLDNLMTLCSSCHQSVHNKNLECVHYDEVVKIEETGIQTVYDLEMNTNEHNFVANGIVVHNCNYNKEKFGNEITVIQPCWFENDITGSWEGAEWYDFECEDEERGYRLYDLNTHDEPVYAECTWSEMIWAKAVNDAEKHYFMLLKKEPDFNWTPQQARSVLPNSLKTEVVMTANFREWRAVLEQRTAQAAHPQIREIMRPLLDELKGLVPVIFDDITY